MMAIRIFFCLVASIFFALTPSVSVPSQADLNVSTGAFTYFVGRWHCDGKFASNARPISANLVFESILDGKFMLFRHDDEAPFSYHAWSEWGWNENTRQFVSTTQDGTGGIRLFVSPGWVGQTLTWSGGNPPNSSDQRFVFERLGERSFRVSYFHKKDASWFVVDSSSCFRVGTN
jgi:hypothetical protein